MSKSLKYGILILFLGAVIFYVFPLIFTFKILTAALLLFINPIYSFIFCTLHTIRFGLRMYLPISIGILFLPAVFLFYEPQFLSYCAIYAAIAFVGSGIGYPIHKRYG
ncbi:MAG: hypothetical protein HFJ84_06550 [Clostridiales bacterium]|nr:hypothetical protein [Clostridiales bacterium]